MREMKDSGVEWLGEVPVGWASHRAKRLFKLTNDRGNEDLTLLAATQKHGMWPQDRLEGVVRVKDDADLSKFRTVHKNDFVISLRSFQGGFERSDFEGVCSPAYQTFCAIRPIDYQYFKYLFKSPSFIDHMNSLTLGIREGKTIKFDDFATQVLPVPSLDEQRRIAGYLDEKCAEIDRAVSAAEQSIEEYKAYRNSIVNQAITKGLNSDAPMKDSGVEWLGEVPSGWKVRYPKFLFVARKERARADDIMLTASQHHGMIPQSQFMEQETYTPAPVEKGHDILKHVEPGDFVISMRSFQGGLEYSSIRGKMSSAYLALYPVDDCVVVDYYRWLFKSQGYIQGLQTTTNLVRDGQALRYANFLKVWLPVPPLDEQRRIADFLDEKCSQIDRAIAVKQAIITDLKAFKQSLIYETVTGKREV